MAISQTTFDQRLNRIEKGQTVDVAAKIGKITKRPSLRARCTTIPFLTGVGILTGGTGYAWVETRPSDVEWVLALASLPL